MRLMVNHIVVFSESGVCSIFLNTLWNISEPWWFGCCVILDKGSIGFPLLLLNIVQSIEVFMLVEMPKVL